MPISPISASVIQLLSAGHPTDGELLECFVARRDELAFAELVRRHGPMVLGVCRRLLRHCQDAEDAFQAAFLVLARKAASVVPRESVAGWLYGVACRTALGARARRSRRAARERQGSDMPERAADAAPDRVWEELVPLLDQELGRLPQKYRLPVVLCELEGRPRKEVASQLGVLEGTLSSRLATARRLLARRLTRRGLALSAPALSEALAQAAVAPVVPPSLVGSTVKAAIGFAAARTAAAGLVGPAAAALTEGVLKAMLIGKLKIATALLLAVGLLAGVGGFCHQSLAGDKPGTAPAGAAPPGGSVGSGTAPLAVQPPSSSNVKANDPERRLANLEKQLQKLQQKVDVLEKELRTLKRPQGGTGGGSGGFGGKSGSRGSGSSGTKSPTPAPSTFRVFPLRHAAAPDVAIALEKMLRADGKRVRIAGDKRTNQLLVQMPDDDLREFAKILEALDIETAK